MAELHKVTRITATPIFPIANRDESVSLQRNVDSEIWSNSTSTHIQDGLTGSQKPVGFWLRKPIIMCIEGQATYPEAWPDKSKGECVIIGSIKSGNLPKIDVLRGSWTEDALVEQAPRKNPLLNIPFKVKLALIEPQGTGQGIVTIPWGFAGDVEWRIESQPPSVQTLVIPKPTRLEIYQLAKIALGGPTEALFAESTLPNLQGKWPVHLLRLFTPGPGELQGKAEDIKKNRILWWANFVYNKVLSLGVQYDALEGRSGYGVGVLGGSFDITSFYDKVDPSPNPFFDKLYLGLNNFDLTSLVEAAFMILLPSIDAQDDPRPITKWVGLAPAGEIADRKDFSMIPIGWQTDPVAANGVSTPFFKGKLAAKAEDGKLGANAWLEIDMTPGSRDPEPALVVQMAFTTKGQGEAHPRPDLADVTREEFLIRHFKDTDLNNHQDWFYDSTSIPPVNNADSEGNDLARRAGVYNLRGVNEPWPWRYDASGRPVALPLPETLFTTIAGILQLPDKRNNAVTARNLNFVNAGSLRPSRIYALLKPQAAPPKPDRYDGRIDYFRLVVGRGVSVATYITLLDPSGSLKNVKARLKISTFEKFSDALDGLVSELGGFECDLKKAIVTNDPSTICGNFMIQTTQNLLFVRNNILVDITVLDLKSYGTQAANLALRALATILDKYFIVNSVPRCQTRKATFEITDPSPVSDKPTKVKIDKPFTVTISNVDLLAEEIGVFVYSDQNSVRQPIIFTSAAPLVADPSVGISTRTLDFLPLQNDADSDQDVDIAISGAHYDTFYPVTKIATVELQKEL